MGDFQCNAAMALGKMVGQKPREVAQALVAAVDVSDIAEPLDESAIAGPGFINIRLKTDALAEMLEAMAGEELGLPSEIVWRHPFPGPGLAIRVVGAVDADLLATLRAADAIAREELTGAGLDRDIWQFPVVLLADVRSVGVQGDERTYGHPVVLRPVVSEDAMTADWARLPAALLERISTRITNEVREVNRVVLDVTSKPPGTIEWE